MTNCEIKAKDIIINDIKTKAESNKDWGAEFYVVGNTARIMFPYRETKPNLKLEQSSAYRNAKSFQKQLEKTYSPSVYKQDVVLNLSATKGVEVVYPIPFKLIKDQEAKNNAVEPQKFEEEQQKEIHKIVYKSTQDFINDEGDVGFEISTVFNDGTIQISKLTRVQELNDLLKQEYKKAQQNYQYSVDLTPEDQERIVDQLTGMLMDTISYDLLNKKEPQIFYKEEIEKDGKKYEINFLSVRKPLINRGKELLPKYKGNTATPEERKEFENIALILKANVFPKVQLDIINRLKARGYKFKSGDKFELLKDDGSLTEFYEQISEIDNTDFELAEDITGKNDQLSDYSALTTSNKEKMSAKLRTFLSSIESDNNALFNLKIGDKEYNKQYINENIVIQAINEITVGLNTYEEQLQALHNASKSIKGREFLSQVVNKLQLEKAKGSEIVNQFVDKFNQQKNDLTITTFEKKPVVLSKFKKDGKTITVPLRDNDGNTVFYYDYKVINANRNDIFINLKNDTKQRFIEANNLTEETVDKSVLTNTVEKYKESKEFVKSNYKQGKFNNPEEAVFKLKSLFETLNFEFSDDLYKEFIKEDSNKFKDINFNLDGKGLSVFNKSYGILNNIFGNLEEDTTLDRLFGNTGATKLLKVEAEMKEYFYNTSTLDGKGRNIWGYSMPSPMFRELHDIKYDDELSYLASDKEQSLYTSSSYILSQLNQGSTEDILQFKNNLKYSLFNTLKQKSEEGKELTQMEEAEFIATQIILHIGNDIVTGKNTYWSNKFLTTPSDKSTMYLIQTPNISIPVDTKGKPSLSLNSDVVERFYNYFLGEYRRAKDYQDASQEKKNKIDSITTYEPLLFYNFPQLNLKNEDNILWKREGNSWVLRDLSEAVGAIDVETYVKTQLLQQLKKEVEVTREKLNNVGLIQNNAFINGFPDSYKKRLPDSVTLNTEFKKLKASFTFGNEAYKSEMLKLVNDSNVNMTDYMVYDYAINYLFHNIEMHTLILGDPAQYLKDESAKFINQKEKNKPQIFQSNNINEIGEYIDKIRDNLSKRMAGVQANRMEGNTNNESSNIVTIVDTPTTSKIIEEIERFNSDQASKYKGIKSMDGQEIMTAEEDLKQKLIHGKISQDLYQTLYDKVQRQHEDIEKEGFVTKQNEFTEEELEKFIAQPIKPVVFGNVYEQDLKIFKTTYYKDSAFGLYPQFTQGLELDKVRKGLYNLSKKGIVVDRLVMKSAAKLGAINPVQDVFNEDLSINQDKLEAITEANIDTVPRSKQGIQLEVPYDPYKQEIRIASQQVKLIFNEILNVNWDNQKELINTFLPELKDEVVTGKVLKNYHNNVYRQIVELSLKSILDEIGINLDINAGTYKFENLEKLSKTLQNTATELGYSKLALDGLSITPDGQQFVLPISFNENGDRLEKLLLSILNKAILQKISGRSFVLASEMGFVLDKTWIEELKTKKPESKDITESVIEGEEAKKVIKKYQSSIVFTDKFDINQGLLPARRKDPNDRNSEILPAQVLVSWKFTYNGQKLDINDFITEKDGRKFLDSSKINEDILRVLGIRIPVQGHPSMASIEIVGFLPKFMGDIIIAPQDFVAMMGSDFDIDKLYGYMYNYQYNKKTKTLSKLKFDESKIEEIDEEEFLLDSEEDFTEAINKLEKLKQKKEEYKKKQKKKMLQNKLIDIYHTVMLHPTVYDKSLQGITEGKLGELTKELKSLQQKKDYNYYSPSSVTNKIDEYFENKAGKLGVGVFSVNNTFLTVVEGLGLELQKTIVEKDDEGKDVITQVPDYFNIPLNADTKENPEKYYIISGNIGVNKLISMFQSASVDNAKLKYLNWISVNKDTMGVAAVLSSLANDTILGEDGQPLLNEDYIVYFLSQPIIKEYNKINAQSIFSDYVDVNALVDELSQKYKENVLQSIETNTEISQEEKLGLKNKLTEDPSYTLSELKQFVENQSSYTDVQQISYLTAQYQILNKFLKLKEQADVLRQVQYLVNADSKGLPSTLAEANYKSKKASEIKQKKEKGNRLIKNLDRVFVNSSDKEVTEKEISTEFTPFSETIDTLQGYLEDIADSVSVQIFSKDNNLIASGTKHIEHLSEIITLFSGKRTEIYPHNLVNSITKSYVAFTQSTDNLQIQSPDKTFKQEIIDLLQDRDDNTSLATDLENFKKTEQYKNSILLKPFLESLKTEVFEGYKFVKYQASQGLLNTDEQVVQALIELQDLDNKKGTYPLFEKLIKYTFLVKIQKSPITIRQFVPVYMQEGLGLLRQFREKNDFFNVVKSLTKEGDILELPLTTLYYESDIPVYSFVEQFFQHNPQELKSVSSDDYKFLDNNKPTEDITDTILIKGEVRNKYTAVKDGKEFDLPYISVYNFDERRFNIFKKLPDSDGIYTKIPNLGRYNLDEYNADTKTTAVSILPSNEVKGITALPTTPVVTPTVAPLTAEEIYSQLGNKTQSENVVIKPWSELKDAKKAVTKDFIVSTRIVGDGAAFNFGNPFSSDKAVLSKNATLIPVSSTKEAVERYINWILTGEIGEAINLTESPEEFQKRTGRRQLMWELNKINDLPQELEERREWIREQLQSGELKGKPILYYKELGEPSHATALDYLINKYDWSTPTAPTVTTVTTVKENPLLKAGVKPTDMYGNAAKDIQMADESTQFIGFQSGTATVSSTNKYREAWGTKANTGVYTANDVVMVSGSGTFRGVTAEQIKQTLTEQYKPLLNAAIAAGASFRVGNQYAKGNLSDQLIAEYLQKNGYVEEKLDGYSRWSKPTTPTVSNVEITKVNYTRQEVQNNPNTAYVFTENTYSITAFPNKQGGGSAIIRPEPNAFAIVTKKKYDYNTKENVDYTDTPEDFKEFTEVNTRLINELKNSGKSKIVFPQGFATDKAKMPTRFAEWLQKELLDNFGLVTELNSAKTGLISKSVRTITPTVTTKILKNEDGLIIAENVIPKADTVKMVDQAKKFIEETSFKQTAGAVSWGYGMQWMRINAMTAKQREGIVIGKQLNGLEITQKMKDDFIKTGNSKGFPLYGYTTIDKNGNKLPPIPQDIINYLSSIGIDISQYDASYNSVYDKTDNGSLIIHQDNTETNKSPIITISLGRPMKFVTYELKDSNDFNVADSNNTAFRIAVNAVQGEALKLNLVPESAKDSKGNVKYGHFTPDTILKYAEEIDKKQGTNLKQFVIDKLKEQFKNAEKTEYTLNNGAVLVFSGNNRNVLHEIVFDPQTNAKPMESDFPTLKVNKAFKGLGQKDNFVNTSDYRIVLTLRKVQGETLTNVVNQSKFIQTLSFQTPTVTTEVKGELFDPSLPKINIYAGTGENAELSNFAIRPFKITNQIFNGTFNTVEGAFQAQKIGYINNKVEQQLAKNYLDKLQNATGSEAKTIGRKLKGLDTDRWDANSSKIMKDLIKQSFEQNPEALQKLLATGNAELTHTQDKGKWGKEFPKLLMEVRQELSQPTTEVKPEVINSKPNRVLTPVADNQKGQANNVLAQYGIEDTQTDQEKVKTILNKISVDSNAAYFRELANLLKQLDVQFNFTQDLKINFVENSDSFYNPNNNSINLNVSQTDSQGKPIPAFSERMQFEILHELIHSVLDNRLGIDQAGTIVLNRIKKLTKSLESAQNLQKAIDLFDLKDDVGNTATVQYLLNKLTTLRATTQDVDAVKYNSEAERSVLNPLINEREFIASVLGDNQTRMWMNEVQYDETGSVLSKILDAFKVFFNNLIRTFGFKVKDKSALQEALNIVFDTINYDSSDNIETVEFLDFGTYYKFEIDKNGNVIKGEYSQSNKNNYRTLNKPSKKYTELLQSDTAQKLTTEEIKLVEQVKNVATVSGKTLQGEQVQAFQKAMLWLNKPTNLETDEDGKLTENAILDNMFFLSGAGGSGKTFITEIIVSELNKKGKIALGAAAPTHQAKNVLKENLPKNTEASTLQGLLGMLPNPINKSTFIGNTLKTMEDMYYDGKAPFIFNYDYLVIDEASMIDGSQKLITKEYKKVWSDIKNTYVDQTFYENPDLGTYLKEVLKLKQKLTGRATKVFLMGDVVQVVPVGAGKFQISKLLTDLLKRQDNNALLTEIRRTNNEEVKRLSLLFRESFNTLFENNNARVNFIANLNSVQANNNISLLNSKKDVIGTFIRLYKENINSGNPIPNYTNIIWYNNSVNEKTVNQTNVIRQLLFNNQEEINPNENLILKSNYTIKDYFEQGKDLVLGSDTKLIVTKVENGVKDFSVGKGRKVRTISNIPVKNLTANVQIGSNILQNVPISIVTPSYFKQLSEKFQENIPVVEGQSLTKGELYNLIENITNVEYGYIVNSHKIQGSKVINPIVDVENITNSPEDTLHINNMIYTAISRTVNSLYIFHPQLTPKEGKPISKLTGINNPEVIQAKESTETKDLTIDYLTQRLNIQYAKKSNIITDKNLSEEEKKKKLFPVETTIARLQANLEAIKQNFVLSEYFRLAQNEFNDLKNILNNSETITEEDYFQAIQILGYFDKLYTTLYNQSVNFNDPNFEGDRYYVSPELLSRVDIYGKQVDALKKQLINGSIDGDGALKFFVSVYNNKTNKNIAIDEFLKSEGNSAFRQNILNTLQSKQQITRSVSKIVTEMVRQTNQRIIDNEQQDLAEFREFEKDFSFKDLIRLDEFTDPNGIKRKESVLLTRNKIDYYLKKGQIFKDAEFIIDKKQKSDFIKKELKDISYDIDARFLFVEEYLQEMKDYYKDNTIDWIDTNSEEFYRNKLLNFHKEQFSEYGEQYAVYRTNSVIEQAKSKIEYYLGQKEAFIASLELQELTSEEKQDKLKDWISYNSPFLLLNEIFGFSKEEGANTNQEWKNPPQEVSIKTFTTRSGKVVTQRPFIDYKNRKAKDFIVNKAKYRNENGEITGFYDENYSKMEQEMLERELKIAEFEKNGDTVSANAEKNRKIKWDYLKFVEEKQKYYMDMLPYHVKKELRWFNLVDVKKEYKEQFSDVLDSILSFKGESFIKHLFTELLKLIGLSLNYIYDKGVKTLFEKHIQERRQYYDFVSDQIKLNYDPAGFNNVLNKLGVGDLRTSDVFTYFSYLRNSAIQFQERSQAEELIKIGQFLAQNAKKIDKSSATGLTLTDTDIASLNWHINTKLYGVKREETYKGTEGNMWRKITDKGFTLTKSERDEKDLLIQRIAYLNQVLATAKDFKAINQINEQIRLAENQLNNIKREINKYTIFGIYSSYVVLKRLSFGIAGRFLDALATMQAGVKQAIDGRIYGLPSYFKALNTISQVYLPNAASSITTAAGVVSLNPALAAAGVSARFATGIYNQALRREKVAKINQILYRVGALDYLNYKDDDNITSFVNKANLTDEVLESLKTLSPFSTLSQVEILNKGVPALAIFYETKIKDKEGKEHSLLDAFDVDDNLNLIWKTEQFGNQEELGYSWYKGFNMQQVISKAYSVQRLTSGDYDVTTSRYGDSKLMVRALMLLRRFMGEFLNSRFGDPVTDEDTGIVYMGTYKALARTITRIAPNYRTKESLQFRQAREKATYQIVFDVAALRTMMLIAKAMLEAARAAGGDDDELEWWEILITRFYSSVDKLATENFQFIDPNIVKGKASTGTLSVVLGDLMDAWNLGSSILKYISGDDELTHREMIAKNLAPRRKVLARIPTKNKKGEEIEKIIYEPEVVKGELTRGKYSKKYEPQSRLWYNTKKMFPIINLYSKYQKEEKKSKELTQKQKGQ